MSNNICFKKIFNECSNMDDAYQGDFYDLYNQFPMAYNKINMGEQTIYYGYRKELHR